MTFVTLWTSCPAAPLARPSYPFGRVQLPGEAADDGEWSNMRLPLTVLAAVCALLMATAAAPAAASAPKPAVGDGSDIAALLTGEPVARPLNAQLQLLFETFLSDAAPGATEAVQLEVSYTYALAPEPAPRARVSILFQPLMPFAVPDDPAFIARLAGRIRQWFELYRPSDRARSCRST
jgi:hypothetical protein